MFRHPGEVIHGGKTEEFPGRVQTGRSGPCAVLEDRPLTDIARGLGIHLETLRKWVREDAACRAHTSADEADADMTSGEQEELRRLRRENARLEEDNEILRKAAAYFARETTR
ncbi:transposase [Streptomyces sp. NBC_01431]|uniref:transposase n=1 Tax=Streptomyces sp. NBC_01431 TaxID=2903863 RepID=UPI003FCE584B